MMVPIRFELRVGDLITTNYSTGSYEILELHRSGMAHNLVCQDLRPGYGNGKAYLNNYQQLANGEYARMNSADRIIFLRRPAPKPGDQFDLFS